jgi:hypothetical protein
MTSSDELDSDPGAGQLYWDPVEWIKQLPGQPMVGYLGSGTNATGSTFLALSTAP